ncbi:hypothetical protein [Streptomyces sp. GESEQ-35]|uniref:hypothetical protein n=1 Tax=Streptomyces sp. GESEQ-35 TaxID=2812657 RepID=UPI001FF6F5B3|nr:hypothetical protein [Streptomyces sp. GESEQ-35]
MLVRIPFTRRPAALAAGLAAVLGLLSSPAEADGSGKVALRLEAPATFLMYHADEGAEAANSDFVVPVAVVRSDGGPARNVKVVVDTSGLTGVATAGKGGHGNCTGKSVQFTCVYGDVQNGGGEANAPFTLHGVDGVEPGDSGTVTYTVTADNAATVTGTTRMTVGGPTLHTPKKTETVKGVDPGASVPLTPRFANLGRFTSERGVALHVTAWDGLRLTSRPENCWFNSEATTAWCGFSPKAAPHTAYATSSPITYTAGPGQLAGTLSYTWSSEPERPDDLTVRGTDAPLALKELAGAAARGLTGGTGNVSVETTVQADYEPVTASVRGRVGDTVKVRLGLRDLGPGRLASSESMGGFEVVPPEGTTVTSIPYVFEGDGSKWACERPERPGGTFVCDIGHDPFSEVRHEGGTTAIAFHIRIDRQVSGAQGTIRTYNPFDRSPGNDTAAIPLDASPAPLYRRHPVPLLLGVLVAATLAVVLYRRRRGTRSR